MTGGSPSDSVGQSAEVFVPSTGYHCELPTIPGAKRSFHTMEKDKTMICGGAETKTSCLTLTGGTWQTTTTLLEER